jgi:hypothetical protein
MASADLIAELIEAGTPPALVAKVAMELGKAEAERAILATRRQNERDRKSRSRDLTGQHVTERDSAEAPDEPLPLSSPQTPQQTPTPVSKSTRTRKGTTITETFPLADDWLAFAKAEKGWSDAQVQAVFADFRDYWIAKPKDNTKLDWLATWRRWVRNTDRVPQPAKPVPEMSKATEADKLVAQAFGKFQRGEIDETEFHRVRSIAQRSPPAARLTPQRTGAAAFGDLISRINPTGAHH